VDAIVGEDAEVVRERLLEGDTRFHMTGANALAFKVSAEEEDAEIPVELLRGSADFPLKLPDANTAAMIRVRPSDVQEGRGERESTSILK
jgi:hypothetical protein